MTSNTPMPASPTRVYIVEDDDVLRADFSRAILASAQLQLLGAAGSLREALGFLASGPQLDLLLTDLGLPDGNGADLIRRLRQQGSPAKALVITVFEDEASVLNALSAGAQGYLLKEASDEDLLRAIAEVMHGDAPLSPQGARYLLRVFAQPVAPEPSASTSKRLTPREAEILTLVSRGHPARDVASRLGLSQHTVNTHLRNCHSKLEARNRLQAINRARDRGQI